MKFLSVFALLMTFLSPGLVHAFKSNYSPYFCEIDTSTAFSQDYFSGSGSITNFSTSKELRLRCPILRNSGRLRVSTLVKVIDNNPTVNFSCSVRVAKITGNGASGRVGYSSGASSTYQDISIATSSAFVAQPWRDMYLECTVPRRSGSSSGSNYSRFLFYTTEEY